MILADNDIKKLVSEGKLIVENYKENHLKGIAYELTIESIIGNDVKNPEEYELQPGQSIYVKSAERISIPENLVGKVVERNSVMRAGLKIDAPVYIPGHTTNAFIRVLNISNNTFTLKKDFKIAQIMFEQLNSVPEQTYDKQTNASYTDESDYKGLGNYKSEYSKLIKGYETAKEDLEALKEKIYGNVMTLMGILVAIFSFITVDFKLLAEHADNLKTILVVNLSLALCISVLMGIVLFFLNGAKNRKSKLIYLAIIILLSIATFIFAHF